MALAGEVTYLRRFAGKFVEIVAAGIGTAVSGYLVAYIAAHFSLFMPAAVEPAPPQAISWSAEPGKNISIEATVRAALANHDETAAPVVATTPQPPAPASPEIQASAATVAPPLAASEIGSLPVAAAVDSALPAEPAAWPSDPAATSGIGRQPAASRFGMLPPQPPPANGNLLAAFKHFF